ncbi:MAG: hypothetical protein WBD28_09050 [Candidatus Zixiibacteriota bacterium]
MQEISAGLFSWSESPGCETTIRVLVRRVGILAQPHIIAVSGNSDYEGLFSLFCNKKATPNWMAYKFRFIQSILVF